MNPVKPLSTQDSLIFDYLVEVFKSPGWTIPTQDLIDSHCLEQEEFTTESSKFLFDEYRARVQTMLENISDSLNISFNDLLSLLLSATCLPFYFESFEKVWASFDIKQFVDLLNTRNYELTVEAMEMMDSEDRQDTTIKNIQNLEREKTELELALKNSLLTVMQEENQMMALKESEEKDLVLALELSAQEYIQGQESSLKDLQDIKAELLKKIQSENFEKLSRMTIEEKEVFQVQQETLENKKKQFEDSVKQNSLLLRKERKLEKINKKLENELNRLESEYKDVEAALAKEQQRLENLSPKKPEQDSRVELNKIQLKKPQNFSIDDLLLKSEVPPTSTQPVIEKLSSFSTEAETEVQARRARYLKMKEMIQKRKANLLDPKSHLEKPELPSLLPLSTNYSAETKAEFLKNFN